MWKFEIIDKIPSEAKSWHVFFHPSMIDAWMKTYTPLRSLTPIVVKGTVGKLNVFLPLVLWIRNWKHAFLRSFVPIGYSDFDYHDPIIMGGNMDEEAKACFWKELVAFLKDNYVFDSYTIDGITDNMASGGEWIKGEICPRLDLKDIKNEEDLMRFFKTSLRGDLRRQMRRLEEIGPLRFKEYKAWEDISETTFTRFMHNHSLRWPHAYKAPKFHENLLREGLRTGVVHFSTLSVGEMEIAWHLGFTYEGRYYYYMPAGNQDFMKYSPTKVHLYYLMRRAVLHKYSVFDHLRGEENYKAGWSNSHIHLNTLEEKRHGVRTFIDDGIRKIKNTIISS